MFGTGPLGREAGIAVIGAVFAAVAPAGVRDPAAFVDAFSTAMWVATGVAALGAVLAIALMRGRGSREPADLAESEAATTAPGELAAGDLRTAEHAV